MNKLRSVNLIYEDGTGIWISEEEIQKMLKAAEAIEMMSKARDAARRIVVFDRLDE